MLIRAWAELIGSELVREADPDLLDNLLGEIEGLSNSETHAALGDQGSGGPEGA